MGSAGRCWRPSAGLLRSVPFGLKPYLRAGYAVTCAVGNHVERSSVRKVDHNRASALCQPPTAASANPSSVRHRCQRRHRSARTAALETVTAMV
jgi:hypothetical protein